MDIMRYLTQMALPEVGYPGQTKLEASSVLVIGAGGLGSAVLWYLAAAGVGTIGIVDSDCVSLENLQRQILYTPHDIGQLKCEVAKTRIHHFNPDIKVDAIPIHVDANNASSLIQNYDLIIDATDNFETRYTINDACVACKKPFIMGAILRFEGQISLMNNLRSDGSRSADLRMLYPEPPCQSKQTTCQAGGVLSALPGIIGSIQAVEALKWLLGLEDTLSGKLLRLNTLDWSAQIFHLS